jgi:sulfotransferase famil protein
MIISHSHRLIFFSNPKTGSESLRQVLEPLAEEIVLPYRQTSRAQPFYPHMPPGALRREFIRRGWEFARYRRLTCVRDPFARLVSLYEMIRAVDRLHRLGLPMRKFPRWLAGTRPGGRGGGGWRHQRWRQYGSWSIGNWAYRRDGTPLVDYIIRLEDLTQDWPALARKLDLPDLPALGHHNRRLNRDYRSYYSPATLRLVNRRYAFDLTHFNYSPPF